MEMFVTTPADQIGSTIAVSPPGETVVSPRAALVAGGVLLLTTILVFFELFRAQAEFALRFPSDWGHTLIVPALVAWLI